MSQLRELLWMNQGMFARPAGYTDSPVAVGATVTPGGQLVLQALWGWSWDGCRFVYGGGAALPANPGVGY